MPGRQPKLYCAKCSSGQGTWPYYLLKYRYSWWNASPLRVTRLYNWSTDAYRVPQSQTTKRKNITILFHLNKAPCTTHTKQHDKAPIQCKHKWELVTFGIDVDADFKRGKKWPNTSSDVIQGFWRVWRISRQTQSRAATLIGFSPVKNIACGQLPSGGGNQRPTSKLSIKVTSNDSPRKNAAESKVQHLSLKCRGVKFMSPPPTHPRYKSNESLKRFENYRFKVEKLHSDAVSLAQTWNGNLAGGSWWTTKRKTQAPTQAGQKDSLSLLQPRPVMCLHVVLTQH